MRMKIAVLLTVMMAVAFAAPPIPGPVVVKLNQEVEVPVTLTNLNTREVLYAVTGGDGGYTFDLSQFRNGWAGSDIFRAEVLGLTKDAKFSDPYLLFSFDVEPVAPPEACPVCPIPAPVQDNTVPAAIVTLFIGLGAGAVVSRRSTGTATASVKKDTKSGKLWHTHKNVSGAHDPNTVHNYMPHKKGELYPVYSTKKNVEGKYDYLG